MILPGRQSSRGLKAGGIQLTSSGSSAHTFRPGLALSGSTHSFEGFANTFPADEDVSFPGPVARGATEVVFEAVVAVDAELVVREVILGREGMATLPLDGPARLDDAAVAPPPADEVEVEAREVIFGFIGVFTFSERGTATDMIVVVSDQRMWV